MFHNLSQLRRKDIQKELGISQPMAVKLLKGLLDKESIVRIGAGKNIVYKRNNTMR